MDERPIFGVVWVACRATDAEHDVSAARVDGWLVKDETGTHLISTAEFEENYESD